MDAGGWKIIYDVPPFQIDDCGSYFAIYKNHKYVGEFKHLQNAIDYCEKFSRDNLGM